VCNPLKFKKCWQHFIWPNDEPLSVVAVCINNPHRSPLGINRWDTASTPSGLGQIVSDGFPLLHRGIVPLFPSTRQRQNADEIDITTGSLDHPEDFPPTKDVYPEERPPWVDLIHHWIHIFTHAYEVRPRKDRRGVDLISDALRFDRLWYCEASNAIGYAKFYSRSHDALIRVYDESGNVIETHEHKGDFRE
jgi:hypothetical protein